MPTKFESELSSNAQYISVMDLKLKIICNSRLIFTKASSKTLIAKHFYTSVVVKQIRLLSGLNNNKKKLC